MLTPPLTDNHSPERGGPRDVHGDLVAHDAGEVLLKSRSGKRLSHAIGEHLVGATRDGDHVACCVLVLDPVKFDVDVLGAVARDWVLDHG